MLYRSYWVAQNMKSDFLDTYDVGTIYRFLKSLKSAVDKFKPDETWVAWDKRLTYPSTNFRKKLADNTYKQHRDPAISEKVHGYHDRLVKWITALGVYQMYPNVLEADDVMSWLIQENKDGENIIVTVDKDLLQLVDSQTTCYNPIKKVIINLSNFESVVGVPVKDFLYYKALLGDTADNIEGVEGYGKAKSKKLAMLGLDAIKEHLSPESFVKFDTALQMMDLSYSFTKEEGEVEVYTKQLEEQREQIKPKIKEFEELCENSGIYIFSRKINEWRNSFVTEQSIVALLAKLK